MLVWSDGSWSPLWVPEWYPPRVGQHMFDPHSFMPILHGIILHLIIGRFVPFFIGLPLALLMELAWEYLENTDFWIEMIGETEEHKESIQHVVGAIICCLAGFTLGSIFLNVGVWWLSILWIVCSEVGCLVYMRDNLLLFGLMILYEVDTLKEYLMNFQVDKIKEWQQEAIPVDVKVE